MMSKRRQTYSAVSRVLIALLFISAGILHFAKTATFVRIVPPGFPEPLMLVQISGVCELLGAAGLLLPRVRRIAGYGLVALLIAVFPANIYMALHASAFEDLAPPLILWLRLPLQPLLALWILRSI